MRCSQNKMANMDGLIGDEMDGAQGRASLIPRAL